MAGSSSPSVRHPLHKIAEIRTLPVEAQGRDGSARVRERRSPGAAINRDASASASRVADLPATDGPQAVRQLLWYLMQVSLPPMFWVLAFNNAL